MPYKDKKQQREYQRNWMRRRRAKYLDGKSCKWCFSTEKPNIHHLDSSTKVSHAIWSWKEERILEELSKCIFLCEKCHVDYHAEEWRSHGISRYGKGCRCLVCKEAKSQNNRRYRKNRAI